MSIYLDDCIEKIQKRRDGYEQRLKTLREIDHVGSFDYYEGIIWAYADVLRVLKRARRAETEAYT